MSNTSKKIVQGTIIVFSFMLLSTLLGYITNFLLARTFSVEEIGLFFSTLSFIMFFFFIRDLGLSESLIYFIPKYLEEKAKPKIKSSIIITSIIQLFNGTVFFIIIFIFSNIISIYYFKTQSAYNLLIILGAYYVVVSVLEVLEILFHGYFKIFLRQCVQFTFNLFVLFGIFLINLLNLSLLYFAATYVFSAFLTGLIYLIVFFKTTFPDFSHVKSVSLRKHGKRLLKYSIPTMFGSVTNTFFKQQTVFFLTIFTGLESVGYYVFAYAIAKLSILFYKAVMHAFQPIIPRLWIRKEIKDLNYNLNQIIIFTLLIAFLFSSILMIFSKEILSILYSEKFLPASTILTLLSFYFAFFILNGITRVIFLSIGKSKIARNLTFFRVGTNFIINLIAIPTLGLIGAGISDILSSIITLVYSNMLIKKHANLNFPWKSISKLLVISVINIVILLILKKTILLNDIYKFALLGSLGVLLYGFLIFMFKVMTFRKLDFLLKILTNNRVRLPKTIFKNKVFRYFY